MQRIPVEALSAARNELCRRWDAIKAKEIRTQEDALAIIGEIQKIREGLDALAGEEVEITGRINRLMEEFWSIRQSLGRPGDQRDWIEEQFVGLLAGPDGETSALQAPPPEAPPAPPAGDQAAPPQAESEEQDAAQAVLRCPFCGGSRFERGKDVYAGKEPAVYCRRTPRPGKRPRPDLCPRLRGSVCLTCGYVLTMVDLKELYAFVASRAARAEGEPPSADELSPEGLQPVAYTLDDAQSVEEALRRLSSATEEPSGDAPAGDAPPGDPPPGAQ